MADLAALSSTCQLLAAPGKGLLAADESTGTVGKRFEKVGMENTEENRRAYRELFCTANVGDYISGAILYKETLSQRASDGRPFVECLSNQGVMPGIKVDEGLVPMDGSEAGETHTRGLDTLVENCRGYVAAGARFAKWRAALKVGAGLPSENAMQTNAEQLADYAKICQACGLVPIVEPELLIDGDHSMQRFADASMATLDQVFKALSQRDVALEACLLKPQMVLPGTTYAGGRPTPEEIADATLAVLRRCVPGSVPGIMFLSGGQSEEEATVNLNALNLRAGADKPWALSFSFGRALQASVLRLWADDSSNAPRAQRMAEALAAANSAASRGKYSGPHPSVLKSDGSLHETFRGWSGQVAAT